MPSPLPVVPTVAIKGSWDGEATSQVDLNIKIGIEVQGSSRLRLVCYELIDHPPTLDISYGLDTHDIDDLGSQQELKRQGSDDDASNDTSWSPFPYKSITHQHQEEHGEATAETFTPSEPNSIVDSKAISASKLPLYKRKKGSVSPQKRPVPIAERPPWGSPSTEDVIKATKSILSTGSPKKNTTHSVETRPSSSNTNDKHLKEGYGERGRALVRPENPGCRAVGKRESSTLTTIDRPNQSPELKVVEWLKTNGDTVEHTQSLHYRHLEGVYDSSSAKTLPRRGFKGNSCHQGVLVRSKSFDDQDDLPNLPPSPTPSSQAAVPWTSVRYRNPLRIRGGGLSGFEPAASFEIDDGSLYLKTAQSMNGKLTISLHATLRLEEDDEKGGYLLKIPGLPMQIGSACGKFALEILENARGTYKNFERIAYVDKANNVKRLDTPKLDLEFPLDNPFILRFLLFEEFRLLRPADFQIDQHVRAAFDWQNLGDSSDDTISVTWTVLCTLMLRPLLFWAESVKYDIFVTGGPSGILQTQLGSEQRRLSINGLQCGAGHELQVSVTENVADISKPFSIVFEKPLGVAPFSLWSPKVTGISHVRDEIRIDRGNGAHTPSFGDVMPLMPNKCDHNGTDKACRPITTLSPFPSGKRLGTQPQLEWYPENQLTPEKIASKLVDENEVSPTIFAEHVLVKPPSAVVGTPTEDERSPPKRPRRRCCNIRIIFLAVVFTWLASRAFVHEQTLQFENRALQSTGSGIESLVNLLDIDIVSRLDDPTSWKTLFKTVSRAEADMAETAAPVEPVEISTTERPVHEDDELESQNSVHEEAEPASEAPEASDKRTVTWQELGLRDRFDRALGWKGPNLDW